MIRRRRVPIWVLAATIYVVGAFLTGAWIANHVAFDDPFDREATVIMDAIAWPGYWLSRVAMWVTK